MPHQGTCSKRRPSPPTRRCHGKTEAGCESQKTEGAWHAGLYRTAKQGKGNCFDQRVVRFCFAKKDETLHAAPQRLQAL